ncbi:hypothetical protein JCM10914A_18570 [Paenibacillus sp. JCM 10914]
MRRKFWRQPSMLLAMLLLLNLLFPHGWASADTDMDAPLNTSGQGSLITQNIITGIMITDKDGTDISEDDVRLEQGARVRIDLGWELPLNHGYKEGAIFAFSLPDKFKVDRVLEGDLEGGVGTYVVTPEGEVTFTFSKEIEDNEQWTGNFYVQREFDERKFSGGTRQEIVFDLQGDLITIPVHFKNKHASEIDKTGTLDKPMNPNHIKWTVDFNKGERVIENAVFKDTLPPGLELDEDSIQVYELEVQLDGSVQLKGQLTEGSEYSKLLNADGFQLEFGGTINHAYRVEYSTRIMDPKDDTFINSVEVTGSNLSDSLKETANVEVIYSKPLEKKSTGYEANSQTISWAIQYNYNEQRIEQDQAWIEDEFDTSIQELVDSSFTVYKMRIEDNGSASETGEVLGRDTDYTVSKTPTGFKLQFEEDIDSAYEIRYQTKASVRVHDNDRVDNTVRMPDGTEATAGRDIRQVIFWKTYTGINYADKTIDWKLSLNDDEKSMTGVVITDSYAGEHMELVAGSLAITDGQSGRQLSEGSDYRLEPDPDYGSGFKITFIQDISTSHVITYATTFDPTAGSKPSYRNTTGLAWNEGTPIGLPAVSAPMDAYTTGNGTKTGAYDATTKEISWTLIVNYNLYEIDQPIVRDFYTGPQKFVEDSFVVQPLELTGNANGVSPIGLPLAEGTDYAFRSLTENGKDGFELTFAGPINSPYQITYRTSLDQLPVAEEYRNEAEMHDAANPGAKLFDKSATVRPRYGGEFIQKSGRQGAGADQEFAYWSIGINRGQSYVEEAIVEDTLSSNQILIPDSFRLYRTIVAKNGALTQGALVDEAEYSLEIEGNAFTLKFHNSIEEAYMLEYSSFINADDGESVSNDISFAGQSVGAIQEGQEETIRISFSEAGGGAHTPGKGNLTVKKIDAANGTPLAGAKFGLYDRTGNTLLQILETDEQGEVIFEDYSYREYILKELEAPAGYLIDDEYRDGHKFVFSSSHSGITVNNTKGNWDVVFTKLDKDDAQKQLPGAVYKLQRTIGGVTEDVYGGREWETDHNGQILLANLEPGSYQFIETKAPKGYKLNPDPIPFTIEVNQIAPKQISASNEIYVGSARLTKTDAFDGTPLDGAEFELQDLHGNPVASGLTTDTGGSVFVDQLRAGSYMFVEVSAPEGYELTTEPLRFEIVDDQTLELSFTNNMITGSLKLHKIEAGRLDILLRGAQFRILDSERKPVQDASGEELTGLVTDETGEFTVPGLRPGKYYAEETLAPAGYRIGQAFTEFEIVQGTETEVTVENIRRISGGGGGGGIDPNPPVVVPPGPVTPETPQPPQPEIPEVPGTIVEPGTPEAPGTGIDPQEQPGNPDETSTVPQPEGEGAGNVKNSSEGPTGHNGPEAEVDESGDGSTPEARPYGNALPKTGEGSHLLLQLAGFVLIVLAVWSFIRNKRHEVKSI